MRSYLYLFISIIIILLNSCGGIYNSPICGNGNVIKQNRNTVNFENIVLSGSIDVIYSEDSTQSIIVEADENLQEQIITEVRNDKTLHISQKNPIKSTNLKIYVCSKKLEKIGISGASNLTIEKTLVAEKLKITLVGAGNVKLNTNVSILNLVISGAGDAIISGKTNEFIAVVSGAGNLMASNLISTKCHIDISGAGKCHINVSNELSANVSGAGDLEYKGNPTITNIKNSGAADITKIE